MCERPIFQIVKEIFLFKKHANIKNKRWGKVKNFTLDIKKNVFQKCNYTLKFLKIFYTYHKVIKKNIANLQDIFNSPAKQKKILQSSSKTYH